MTREERKENLDWLYRLRSEIYVYMPIEWIAPMHIALDAAIQALEQESCENWYDVPSDKMTLEQARQAVRDLRKKLVEYLVQEPTTKNSLGVDCISRAEVLKLMQDNWHTHDGDWAMQESMDDIRALPSVTPQESCDECEVTFKDDNAVSRLSVRDIIYANAYELEYPDGSSEYVVNRDESIKYLMELPSVTQTKIGKWCEQNDDYFDWYECSECGYGSEGEMQYSSEYDVRTNYCPNCGAKMVEPQESEEKE